MRNRTVFLAMLLLFAFAAVPLAAQSSTSTYTTYDGLVSFTLPPGWVVDSESDAAGVGFFAVASSESTLEVIQSNSGRAPSAGEVGALVMRWPYLMQTYAVGQPGDAPADVLDALFGDQINSLGLTVQQATIGNYPAASFRATDENSAGAVYALDLGIGGVMVFAFSTATDADYAQLEPTILSFLSSVDFGSGSVIHYMPSGFFPVSRIWSPDSQTYALVANYPLGEQAVSAALYNLAGDKLAEVAGTGVVWNADGSRAALYGDRKGSAAVVIDTATGEELFVLGTSASSVRWSPDESLIVAGDLRASLRIWDAETGRQLHNLDPAQSWAFNADQTLLAVWNYAGDTVTMYDMENGGMRWVASRAPNYFDAAAPQPEVSWSPDGASLLVIAQDGTPNLLNAADGTRLASYPAPDDMKFTDVNWQAQGLVLGYHSADCRTGSCEGIALVIDPTSGAERFRLPHISSVGAVVWSPDGTRIASATDFDALIVTVWDAESGEPIWETPVDASTIRVNLHWIGDERLLVESHAAVLPLLDAETGAVIALNDHSDTIEGVFLSADGSSVLVEGGMVARVRSNEDGAQIAALPHDAKVITAWWSADESLIYTSTEDGTFTAWDAASGRPLVRLHDRLRALQETALFAYVSPDGEWVATQVSGSAYQRIWPLGTLLEDVRAAIATETTTVDDSLNEIQATFEAGEFETVIDLSNRLLESHPTELAAYNFLAIAAYQSGQPDVAIATLEKAILIEPAYLRGYVNLGDILRREEKFADAREAYTAGLEKAAITDGDRAALYNRIGLTYMPRIETLPEAVEAFTSAIELDSANPLYLSNRAFGYYHQGEDFYAQALADLEAYVEMAGADADPAALELLDTLKGDS